MKPGDFSSGLKKSSGFDILTAWSKLRSYFFVPIQFFVILQFGIVVTDLLRISRMRCVKLTKDKSKPKTYGRTNECVTVLHTHSTPFCLNAARLLHLC